MNNQKEQSFRNEVTETRKLVIIREHAALLVWGFTAVGIGLLIYILQNFGLYGYNWMWIALPVIASPLQWYVDRRRSNAEFTPLYQMLGKIGIVTMVLIAITALLTIPYNFNAYFVITLILSIWCGLSGFMLDYPRLWQLAIGGLAMTIALRILSPGAYQLPVFIVGLCVTLIAPGLDMYRHLNTNKSYKTEQQS